MELNQKLNLTQLEQVAIKSALKEDWETAIKANEGILEKDPSSQKAKMRLGRALLQTKKFKEAEKIFNEILKKDPINKIAKKNYELAKSKKAEKIKATSTKKFLNEPGTSEEAIFELEKKIDASKYEKGDEFDIRINKKTVSIYDGDKKLGKIESAIVQRLNTAKKQKATVTCEFKKVKNNAISVVFKSNIPVLKAQKQEVKPYIKNNTLVEDDDEE